MFRFLEEVRLQPEVGVADAGVRTGRGLQGSKNGKVGSVDVDLEIVRQPVIQAVIGGVLPEVRVQRMLKRVNLIEEFKVPLSPVCDRRIVCVERLLSAKRRPEQQ